jgi:hypothetical protein
LVLAALRALSQISPNQLLAPVELEPGLPPDLAVARGRQLVYELLDMSWVRQHINAPEPRILKHFLMLEVLAMKNLLIDLFSIQWHSGLLLNYLNLFLFLVKIRLWLLFLRLWCAERDRLLVLRLRCLRWRTLSVAQMLKHWRNLIRWAVFAVHTHE